MSLQSKSRACCNLLYYTLISNAIFFTRIRSWHSNDIILFYCYVYHILRSYKVGSGRVSLSGRSGRVGIYVCGGQVLGSSRDLFTTTNTGGDRWLRWRWRWYFVVRYKNSVGKKKKKTERYPRRTVKNITRVGGRRVVSLRPPNSPCSVLENDLTATGVDDDDDDDDP